MPSRSCMESRLPPTDRPLHLSRRTALLQLALLPACGLSDGGDAGDGVALPLDQYPELAEPGASAVVSLPSALLELVVIHRLQGDFCALWRICPHGACTVEYEADRRELFCPCHGSRFDESGARIEGPARAPLRSFAVARVGDTLWISRQPGKPT
jgi:cytochrome b6-f complex iron-sulfur subunit